MEHLSGGDLLDRILKIGSLDERITQKIAQQIAGAVRHAHSRGIAHRDIRPENVCFTDNDWEHPVVKLIDWGFAECFADNPDQRMVAEVGSCNYAAPEVLEVAFGVRESGYTCACDLWSFGVVTYEMLCGQTPFWGDLGSMKSESVYFGGHEWQNVSVHCKDFIKKLLRAEPESRMSIAEVFQHPFVKVGTNESELWMEWSVLNVLECVLPVVIDTMPDVQHIHELLNVLGVGSEDSCSLNHKGESVLEM
jgi:serine/threonine protein kinase